MAQAKEMTLQLSDVKLDNLRGFSIISVGSWLCDCKWKQFISRCWNTCTPGVTNEEASKNNEDFEPLRNQQDQNIDECLHCFCRPCITNKVNEQQPWEDEPHPGHVRNKSLRKETYKRFWKMMYHRNVRSHPSYIQTKIRALQRDHRYRNFVYHRRDLMPDCVFKLCQRLVSKSSKYAVHGPPLGVNFWMHCLLGHLKGMYMVILIFNH